jgi:type 1 fimbriae regulatory protein FimB/type 1 fimbriae regulatory protein FimE
MRSKVFRISKAGQAHVPSLHAIRAKVCNDRRTMSISQHFREKTPKRESQTISPAAPVMSTTAGEAGPTPENGKVTPPRRLANRARRTREHLTPQEVEKLIMAASRVGRYGHRDATLILLAYRHGLRVSELVALRWDQVDLEQGLLHVSRLKHGVPSTHPLRGPEIRAVRRVRREFGISPYVFTTERRGAMTDSSVRKIVARAGEHAQLGFPVHPHMLRHACGFKLANEGHDTRAIQHYLGHRNIQHTVRYTEMASERFKGFWRD